MSKINWIHLSDWHQKDEEFDRKIVRDALVEDIKNRKDIDVRLEVIDFIIFSGDLIFSGTATQYETAIEFFLKPIIEVANISPDRLFIVPGNHDMNIEKLGLLPRDIPNIFRAREEIVRYLGDNDYREGLLKPFREFNNKIGEFVKTERPEYACLYRYRKFDNEICILGINSALLCARIEDPEHQYRFLDKGTLIIGEPQFEEFIKTKELKEVIDNAEICIAVVHHPLDYLNDSIDYDTIKKIKKYCDFILSGHTHKFNTNEIREVNSEIRIISAGASYNRRKESNNEFNMSYNFVHFDLGTKRGSIFYRRWDDPNWGAYRIDNMKDGKVDFILFYDGHSAEQQNNEPADEPRKSVDIEKYRTWLQQETEWLDFRPFFPDQDIGLTVLLKDLYFDIKKINDESVKDIVKANPRVLLEGKPGIGKSIILKYLALTFSQDKEIIPLWFRASSLLSFITQRRLTHGTQQLSKILLQFWCEYHESGKELFNEDWLTHQLEQGNILFIMDGLDELFEHLSPILINIIDDVVKQYSANRWVITCLSTESNSPRHSLLPRDFRRFRIEPFSDKEIALYIHSLTEVLMHNKDKFKKVPPNKKAFEHDVLQVVFDHPDSIDFFRSPLTLTVATCLYWDRDDESRLEMEARIYRHALNLLLRRLTHDASFFPLQGDIDKIQKCLQLLALDVLLRHSERANPERYFEDPTECVQKIAKIFDNNPEKAQELIEWEESVSGLTERSVNGGIRYHNKAVLIYLAACELAERFYAEKFSDYDQQSREILQKQFAHKNENWQAMISFIPIVISQKKWGDKLIKDFIACLLESRENDSLKECVRVIGGLKNILSYIQNFGITPDEMPELQIVKDIAMELFDDRNKHISAKERYDAAVAIGFVEDPRFEDSSYNWVFIPGGQARIGAKKTEDEYARSDESPVHIVYTAAFEIGKKLF